MRDDILIGDTPKARRRKRRLSALSPRGRLWKHSTLDDIAGVADPEGHFVFTLVRNPWDRMVSYYHWLRGQGFAHPAVALAQSTDFHAFLNAPQTLATFAAGHYGAYVSRDGREHCQLFARIEAHETDLAPLWAHLGFRLTLPLANRSDRRADWRSYYSDADAALIAGACAADIARFGYGFDDWRQQGG